MNTKKNLQNKKNISLTLFILLLFFSGLVFTTQSAIAGDCTQYHNVQSGETLYLIGLKYDITWDKLVEYNDLEDADLIYWGTKLCVSVDGSTQTDPTPDVVPSFSIISVEADQTVTIKAVYFPTGETFDVLMGDFGTKGVNGIEVDTIDSGKDGSFEGTFEVPTDLQGSYKIAICLQSSSSGFYSYNWFYNNKNSGTTDSGSGYTGFPTFDILSVIPEKRVIIKTDNLPANDSFVVSMGTMGTKGVNGIKVKTVDSGEGGSLELTFNIPAVLRGSYQIAIRLESPTSGYYAFNWFYNN